MRQERSLTEYVLLERNSISLFVIHELEEKKVVLSLTIWQVLCKVVTEDEFCKNPSKGEGRKRFKVEKLRNIHVVWEEYSSEIENDIRSKWWKNGIWKVYGKCIKMI